MSSKLIPETAESFLCTHLLGVRQQFAAADLDATQWPVRLPPEGQTRWTMTLLAARLVEREIVEHKDVYPKRYATVAELEASFNQHGLVLKS